MSRMTFANVERMFGVAPLCLAVALAGCNAGSNRGSPQPNANSDTEPVPNANTDPGTGSNNNSDEPPINARPVITTIAGSGVAGFNGETNPPLEMALYLPMDISFGPDGTLYIVDWNNHRIRRMEGDNLVTILGTGQIGDAPDGDPLSTALNHPTNVTFDENGDMVVAAWHNSKVKRLEFATGEFVNVAGTGARSFGGDGGPANDALLDLPSGVVVDSIGAYSRGAIIFSDQANQRIRIVDTNGMIQTLCGTGMAGYAGDGGRAEEALINAPVGQAAPPASRIDMDMLGNIYLADTGNHVIRVIDNAGIITTIAGTPRQAGYGGDGGPATAALLNTPSDVEVTPDGVIYIADTFNHVIRRITPDGIITTIAGAPEMRGFAGDGEAAEDARLDRPYGIAVSPDGELYVADTHNHRIRRVTADLPPDFVPDDGTGDGIVDQVPCTDEPGSICTFAGTGVNGFNGDGRDRLQTALYWPYDLEFTPSGRTYVLDWNNHMVREILDDGTFITRVGEQFVGDGPLDLSDLEPPGAPGTIVTLNHPTDLLELPNGNLVIVAWHNHKLRMLDPQTQLVTVIAGRGASFAGDNGPVGRPEVRFNQLAHAALDPDGNLLIVDQRNQRLRLVRDFVEMLGDGIVETVLGTGMPGFNGDGLTPLETQVRFPTGSNPEPTGGIAIDSAGVVYFADSNNNRIRRVEFNADYTDGVVSTIAGTGTAGSRGDGGLAVEAEISFPADLELGPDGNLYFADTNNNKVRMVDLVTGIITTVAGTGERGYSGDGGQAVDAMLSRPFGVAFDEAEDLYVSDTFNGRIRRVTR